MASNELDISDDFEIKKDHLELLDSVPVEIQRVLNRINARKPFYIYNQAEEIIRNELDPRFRDADKDMNDRGRILFLYGDFNTGKSYLLRYSASLLKRKYPNYWDVPNQSYPIIILNLRDDINTAKQLLLFLLDQLGKPVDPRQLKEWEKTNVVEIRLRDKLIAALESYKTRILILDECQRLLKARNPDIPNIFEALKDLTIKSYWKGELRTHFVLCGTQDGLPLLDAADWIQGRAHSIKLKKLPEEEYGLFLWAIYEDFIGMGISKRWDLVIPHDQTGDQIINSDIALFLYKRSFGKVGLTVELIRDAVKRALNDSRLFPNRDDYKLVILEGINYHTTEDEEKTTDHSSAKIKIMLGLDNHLCKMKGCPRSRRPYVRYKSLVQHYKTKHKDVELVNREGDRI